jgi:hypothetical protein
MRKHFDSKKNSFGDDDSNDHRKHKKMSAYREDKNWKNHLLDGNTEEPADEDFFNFDEDEE